MKSLIFGTLTCIASLSVQAQTYNCSVKGQAGGNIGNHFWTDSLLKIELIQNGASNPTTLSANGYVKVATMEFLNKPYVLDKETAYIGIFKSIRSIQNMKYNPRKYKNFIRFDGVDATVTAGQENGMWGYLAIDKDFSSKSEFSSVYVFQAGDHMGGSLPLNCKLTN